MSRIFINYRRGDTATSASRLYEWLSERYGDDQVFMDVDTIEPGLDWAEAIDSAVGSSDLVLALIGDDWLPELAKWNWGAFLLGPIWGLAHGVNRALLTLVPVYGLYEWVMLGRNGNRWAWEARKWDSVESFHKTQRKWATWAIVADVLLVIV